MPEKVYQYLQLSQAKGSKHNSQNIGANSQDPGVVQIPSKQSSVFLQRISIPVSFRSVSRN